MFEVNYALHIAVSVGSSIASHAPDGKRPPVYRNGIEIMDAFPGHCAVSDLVGTILNG